MTPPRTQTQGEAIAEVRGEIHVLHVELEGLRREMVEMLRSGDKDAAQQARLLDERIKDVNEHLDVLEKRVDNIEKMRSASIRLVLTSVVFPIVVGLLVAVLGAVIVFVTVGGK